MWIQPVQVKSFDENQMVFTRACNAGKGDAWVPWIPWRLVGCCCNQSVGNTGCFPWVSCWGMLGCVCWGLLEQQGQHQPPWNDQFLVQDEKTANSSEGSGSMIRNGITMNYLYLIIKCWYIQRTWFLSNRISGPWDPWWSCSWDSAIHEDIIALRLMDLSLDQHWFTPGWTQMAQLPSGMDFWQGQSKPDFGIWATLM